MCVCVCVCVCVYRLFLPKFNSGLDIPHLVTMYKKIQAAKAGSHMYSSDSTIRAIATQDTLHESQLQRPSFHPHQEVVNVMKEDPGASKKVISRVKAKIPAEDTAARLDHTTSLQVQGLTVREFEVNVAHNWSSAIFSLPEWCFKSALNAVTDTFPHNANLVKWKKLSSSKCQLCGDHQSRAHVLNSCQKALNLGRYTTRHDKVLKVIHDFIGNHLSSGFQMTVDLPGHVYSFPQTIALTDQRPDIVLGSPTCIALIELMQCPLKPISLVLLSARWIGTES